MSLTSSSLKQGKRRRNYCRLLYFTFLFSLFVFVSAAGKYFRILTDQYFSIWTGPDQYNVVFRILSELVFGLRYTPSQMAFSALNYLINIKVARNSFTKNTVSMTCGDSHFFFMNLD